MTTAKSKSNQATTLAQLQALVSGLQKQLPNESFTLVSNAYTTTTLVPALQGTIAALNAVAAAHAGLKAALTAWDAEVAKMGPQILALKRILQSMYAKAPDTLLLFGLEPRKAPAPRTAAEKAASAAKARATREARGTGGSKQKAAITGNVTGVTITPVTAPAAPATSTPLAPATPATPAVAK